MKRRALRKARLEACRCAATVLSTRKDDESLVPLAWCLSVFFEAYMTKGSSATHRSFGPKKPVKLKVATP